MHTYNKAIPVRVLLSGLRSLLWVSLLLASYAALSRPCLGQTTQNKITGFVSDEYRQPIEKATVELFDDLRRVVARTTTDGGGRYLFGRLALGRYSVRVSVLGGSFKEQEAEVEISSAARGSISAETIQQDFRLKTKSPTQPTGSLRNEVVFAQTVPKDAEARYEKGHSLLKKGKSVEGIEELKGALDIFPEYYTALRELAAQYLADGKYGEAAALYERAIVVNPRDYDDQYGLAYSLDQVGKYPEANDAIGKALDLKPSSVNALFIRGVIYKHLGRYQDAVDCLNRVVKTSTGPVPDAHWQLSLIYTNNLKKYSEAAHELELFLAAKPDYADADKVRDLIKKLKAKVSSKT